MAAKEIKVVLFFPKFEEYKDYHYFPISLLQICAPLVEKGIECKIIDERVNPNYESELLGELRDATHFATTGFTGFSVSRAYEVSKLVREHSDIPIIWGGPHATALPEQTLKSEYIDYVVTGFGDYTFAELIAGRDGGRMVINPPCRFDPPLFPTPYWLVDVSKYINPKTKRFAYLSSYGCPGVCTFCSTRNQRRWIPLGLDKVKRDLDYLLSNYDFREIVFFDATMTTLHKRLLELADFLGKYDVKWIMDGRAIELCRWELTDIERLIWGGLEQVTLGLETGSDHVVGIMKKGTRHLEKYETITRKLAQLKVKQVSGLIFGTPGETISDLEDTVAYVSKIRDINPDFRISSTFFRPLPGTELYNVLVEQGLKMPQTLEEWATEKDRTHYRYNQWMDIPWMDMGTKEQYRKIYDGFVKENADILV